MKATECKIGKKMRQKCVLCESTNLNGLAINFLEIQIIFAKPITVQTHTAKVQPIIWPYTVF
jgi:hypothetical protein